MRWIVVALLLSGCASASPVLNTAVCPPVKSYTAQQQLDAANAYGALPVGSILRTMIDDYGQERAELRACRQ